MKRLYQTAAAEKSAAGFLIYLDGKPIHTPAKNTLTVPTQGLAEAIADEWNAQGETIDKNAMPLTRFATIAIDLLGTHRESRIAIIEELLTYADTDLILHRAPEPALAATQERYFAPVIAWLAADGIILQLVQGIIAAPQPARNRSLLAAPLNALDDFRLSALSSLTPLTGSLFLSLYFLEGRMPHETLFSACRLEESYQMEKWGKTDMHLSKEENLRTELAALNNFLLLIQ